MPAERTIDPAPSTIAAQGVSTGRAFYTLFVLSTVCMLNYYDRNLINILIEPIKLDLGLSDAQLGIVSGTAFGIVYCAAAIPIGRLADRRGRLRVLVAALALWSLMTGACGLARNFVGMVAARCGVGFGESAGLPTTHALVAEHFSPAWRGRALAVIAVMSAAGSGLGSGFGGVIADRWGWQAAFFSGAIPGLLVALLLGLTVREPRPTRVGDAARLGFAAAMAILWRRTAFIWLCLGMGIGGIGIYAFTTWIAPFMMRSFHASAGQVGAQLSVVFLLSNVIGVGAGGFFGDMLSQRDRRWPFWICAICFGLGFVGLLLILSLPTLGATVIGVGLYVLVTSAYVGPLYAAVQQLCGDRLRATGSAILLTVANLIGLGAGPWFAGFLSDRLRPSYGDGSLRIAMMITSTTMAVGAICFLIGARTAIRDIADAERDGQV